MFFGRFIKKDNKNLKEQDTLKGLKKEIYFFDKDGNSCEEKDAVTFIGRIVDENGNLVNETFGRCVPKNDNQIKPNKKK